MRCRDCSEHTPAPLLLQPGPDYAPAAAPTPESGFGTRGVAAATGQVNLGYGKAVRPKLLGGASQVWGAAGAQTAATAYGKLRGVGATRWGPSPRAPGFPSAESRRRPAPNTGVSASGGVLRAALPAGREAAGERSLKNLPPGTLKGRTRRRSVVRPARAERKGREERVPALTGHGDGSGSNLPPLRPLVLADVAGPAPSARRHQVVPFLPPLHARTPTLIGQKKTRGARCHAPAPEGEERSSVGGAPGAGRGFPGALGPARRN